MKILHLFVFAVFLCVSSFAQNKIAVVDTDAFYDEKSGITEFITANKILEAEFKPQIERFNDLGKELEKFLSICSKTGHCGIDVIEKRIAEYEKQKQHIEQTVFPQFEKRKAEIVEPLNKRIAEKLTLFAKQNSCLTIFELKETDDSSGLICRFDNLSDVTNEFIKFCNEEFEKEKSQKR